MAETLTIRTASSTEVVKIAVPGPQGATGAGVPTGGSTGQVLRKASGSDYDTEWAAAGAGSGSVTSVALASTDLTITGSPITTSGTITANIAANAVTLEKLQTISSEHLLGRHGNGNGGVQQIGLGTGLAMSGSNIQCTVTAPTASSATPSSLGTAASGSSSDYARADHTHSAEVSDSAFRVTGSTDATKKVALEVDTNVPANTTVTLTAPSSGGTIALAGDAPAAHAASHAAGQADELFDQSLNQADNVTFGSVAVSTITGDLWESSTQNANIVFDDNILQLNADSFAFNGFGALALASHTHTPSEVGLGNVSNTAQVTSVSGTAPIVSSGGTTPVISVTTGTTAGTVAAGDDSRITGAAQKSANLSDLASASTARTNLGLGTAATAATGDFAAATHTHTATAISDSTTAGRALLTAADAAAQRTSLGLAAIATSGSASDLGSGTVPIGRLGASGTPSGSTYLAGDNTWKAAGGVTTGSVDNAVLRADGTGGSTSQSSDINILDATTSTQNNVAITNEHSGQTNSALVLGVKGTGAFIVSPARPDGAATGGNARGASAICIQTGARSANTNVASGADSIAIGRNSKATGSQGIAIGTGAYTASGGGVIIGGGGGLDGNDAVAIGAAAYAQTRGTSLGFYAGFSAYAQGVVAIGAQASSGSINAVAIGDSVSGSLRSGFFTRPFNAIYWSGQTTTNAATVLNLDGTATNRFTIAASTALAVDILLVARRATTQDKWLVARRFLGIRRDGSNNTALIGTVQTIGTDQSEGSPTWTFALTADDTNEALQLEVTGATGETVEWRATAFYRVA